MTRLDSSPRPEDTLRRRADGSIDTAFYIRTGRRHRSEQAHSVLGGLFGGRRR